MGVCVSIYRPNPDQFLLSLCIYLGRVSITSKNVKQNQQRFGLTDQNGACGHEL